MARPHIEFLQSQWLDWEGEALSGIRPGVARKVLSMDDVTGACSLLLRYPAGWRLDAPQTLGVDEEFLVLDGDLDLNGHAHGYLGYAHLPAGYRRETMASQGGAVVLTFFSAAPEPGPATTPNPSRLVEGLDGFAVPYTGNFHPEFPPGAGRKMLYEDPLTGDQSWILGTLGLRWAERAEKHPVVEEMYLLAGEVHGDRGVMRPGAYFWRPPQIAHGPYGSLTGNVYFFRTKGGKLQTEYEDAAAGFRWWPAFQPILPDSLAPLAVEAASARPW